MRPGDLLDLAAGLLLAAAVLGLLVGAVVVRVLFWRWVLS